MTPERLAELRTAASERRAQRQRERAEFTARRRAGLVWRHATRPAHFDPPPDIHPDEILKDPDPPLDGVLVDAG
jgi:hypothetical protein